MAAMMPIIKSHEPFELVLLSSGLKLANTVRIAQATPSTIKDTSPIVLRLPTIDNVGPSITVKKYVARGKQERSTKFKDIGTIDKEKLLRPMFRQNANEKAITAV